ncbi:MAG: hydrogenase iron-sulfur subunit [Methanomassiliicoccales archaeon]|jgi:coenzyme F420-reducing hydrogenase delta subunit|nr:hydrogenase iron-sulfur subunit [Methanomassiliicoccales archaeon]
MKVIGFVCEHGGAAAFTLAGERRFPLPSEVTLIALPCLGRLGAVHILRAFREGAAAVFVAGCLEGNCHHLYGNLEAGKRVEQARRILAQVGMDGRRLEIFHLSSDQAWKAREMAEEMVRRARELGPSPLEARA